ncbi:MAG: alpha-1,4-glucan--maltose-1-phosphate maltosyltransferase [Parachlamydia sp.]|jgi:starch synthase (maltosyl-transferring)|nr:alpha-1,4-glucan--maltose-1-phosphate maltosyltransferase [Parachlamydia sp.]
MLEEGRNRTVIVNVTPLIDEGRYPIKRVTGEKVFVSADIFADGHGQLAAYLLFRRMNQSAWEKQAMSPLGNDRWGGHFTVHSIGEYEYTIIAWIDRFKSWQHDFQKNRDNQEDRQIGINMLKELERSAELEEWLLAIARADQEESIRLLLDPLLHSLIRCHPLNQRFITELDKNLKVIVDPKLAQFSAWYEMFPRSAGIESKHGTFKDCARLLSTIAGMGFDILYLPPIHPIGHTKRKGKNNQLMALDSDPGSPWAIGSHEGGHYATHPCLGTLQDFKNLVAQAKECGIAIAIDLAYQCSPDHPYIQEHPEWFSWRPDGSIQYAENPPKKYEDIVPFNFECSNWKELWHELRDIVYYWINQGVTVFRVDNPHTKPFPFWEWLIETVKQAHPEIIFLSEAFTRPKVMLHLAKIGFTQSYTYFTWRHTKKELTDYVVELTKTPLKEFFRPNFWPNTPDILPKELQSGGKEMFMVRFILAATLSSNYGLYGPPFELMIARAIEGTEEYLDAEKYESHAWTRREQSLEHLITRLNAIRKKNPALQITQNIEFHETDNEHLLFYSKIIPQPFNALLIAVNLKPAETLRETLRLPLQNLGLHPNSPYLLHELLTDRKMNGKGEALTLTLEPGMPAALFKIKRGS